MPSVVGQSPNGTQYRVHVRTNARCPCAIPRVRVRARRGRRRLALPLGRGGVVGNGGPEDSFRDGRVRVREGAVQRCSRAVEHTANFNNSTRTPLCALGSLPPTLRSLTCVLASWRPGVLRAHCSVIGARSSVIVGHRRSRWCPARDIHGAGAHRLRAACCVPSSIIELPAFVRSFSQCACVPIDVVAPVLRLVAAVHLVSQASRHRSDPRPRSMCPDARRPRRPRRGHICVHAPRPHLRKTNRGQLSVD
ncbi:hypothetical protein C8Q80DRAFT_450912 [Daedaleopsis nitida]|nr:hypothetical protein C8Q80DRAFT_450912 [Daedaleopsis nitida]